MRTAQFFRLTAAAALVLATYLASPAAAAEPNIHEFAKAAVARKEIKKTDMVGFTIINTDYRDLQRDGAILVGFDLAIRNTGDAIEIGAIRPRYLTPSGPIVGQSAGSFSSSRDHKISKVERVEAKPGYAVGSATFHTGIGILGMSVKFMRIAGASLDSKDSYRSPWIGRRGTSSQDKVLDSNGGAVVGVFGNVNGPHVLAIGFLSVNPPEVEEAEPAAVETPAAVTPPNNAALTAPVSLDVPAETEPPAKSSIWLPVAIGVLVVLMVGGAFLVISRIGSSLASPKAPPRPQPTPISSPTPQAETTLCPQYANDYSIPVVHLADPEPTAFSSRQPVIPPPPSRVPESPAANVRRPVVPPPPSPPSPVAIPGQLGRIESEGDAVAPQDRHAFYSVIIMGAIFLVIGIGLTVVLIHSEENRILVPTVMGSISLSFFIGAGYYRSRFGKHVAVHEHGIRFTHGKIEKKMFWADVEAVRDFSIKLIMNGMHAHTTRTVTLRSRSGQTIEFSGDPAKIQLFAEDALRHAYDHIAPKVMQQLSSGQPVDLGPLWVSSAGVETPRESIEWSRIGDVRVEKGQLKIFEGGQTTPWASVPLGEIDNYRLLFALMQQFGGVACVP